MAKRTPTAPARKPYQLPEDFTACDLPSAILAFLRWNDASTRHGWIDHDDVCKETPMRCATVGFIVRATRQFITVVSTGSEYGKYMEPLTIPRDWIISVTPISRRLFTWPKSE